MISRAAVIGQRPSQGCSVFCLVDQAFFWSLECIHIVCVCVCVCVCERERERELIKGHMQYGDGPIDNSLISTIFDATLLSRKYLVTLHIMCCLHLYDDEPEYRITLFH